MTELASAAFTASSPAKAMIAAFLHDVWDNGNTDAVDMYLAESYTIHHDPGDGWHGQTLTRDGFKHRLVTSRAPFPDQKFSVTTMLEEGNRVAVTWRWSGTFLADLPGFPATGKPVHTSGITIYSVDGDRLTGHWQVTDRLSVFQQLR